MRQVPRLEHRPYAILGSGQMALHLSHYFEQLNIPYHRWARANQFKFNSIDPESDSNPESRLESVAKSVDTLFLLIRDSEIGSFVEKFQTTFDSKQLVHFSGALELPSVVGFHPLMSFSNDNYDLQLYCSIPFVGVKGQPKLSQLIPELTNPYYEITSEQKAYYHALCVIAGNFTSILWKEVNQAFLNDLKLPEEVLLPYMNRIFSNLLSNPSSAETGPLARKDQRTIEKNLQSLTGRKLLGIYKAFLTFKNLNPNLKSDRAINSIPGLH